jgi:type II secretory ATPase GspE/PulE/Tfp pilus assembly ATPase PilB-like protein/ActR/RegA family two-component response regulator
MTHWLAAVAEKQGLTGRGTLDFPPDASNEDIWAATASAAGVPQVDLARAVAAAFRTELADLGKAIPAATKLLPASIARKFGVLPLKDGDRFLLVATSDPTNHAAEQEIGFISGRKPVMAVAPPKEIAEAIERAYSPELVAASLLSRFGDGRGLSEEVSLETESGPEETSEADAGSGPIVHLTNLILREAVTNRASDIHIQPKGDLGVVRFRLDGVLKTMLTMPLMVLVRVVSRIKVMSDLDITDRMRPQDGRARIVVKGAKYDLRVSTVPTREAEKAVIRVLDTTGTSKLDDTGIDPRDIERVRDVLSNRDGIFVVTGPTGSGKTTTLYGALGEVSTEDVNIMSVEDPVEYELPGLTQIQVETKQGMTFASALRAILRQDPDVIFIGEIRDSETAEIAAQASLTGHLVLASLHTNDALGSIRRLMDLGLDPGTVAETLRGVLAQRLVRRVCSQCAEPVTPPFTEAEEVLHRRFHIVPSVRAKGCERCGGQGYAGRLPVTEFLTPTPDLARLIVRGALPQELARQAARDGMRTLLESALDRVRAGETTLEEVERVIGRGEKSADSDDGLDGDDLDGDGLDGGVMDRVSENVTAAAPFTAREEGPSGSARKILIVDDDGTVRTIARALLEKAGHEVCEANDGSEALARLSRGEGFALMLLDLDMPMLGGREVLAAVRRSLTTATLPVVVLTGTTDPGADIELLELGADDYIRKPIDPPRLVTRVNAALRRAQA